MFYLVKWNIFYLCPSQRDRAWLKYMGNMHQHWLSPKYYMVTRASPSADPKTPDTWPSPALLSRSIMHSRALVGTVSQESQERSLGPLSIA